MTAEARSLFDIIDTLRPNFPTIRSDVEHLLGQLELVDENVYIRFFRSTGLTLADAVSIDVDYRERKGPPLAPDLLTFSVTGQCLSRAMISAHYRDLVITSTPRGHAPSEKTVFSRGETWGNLSFGFAASDPDCLAMVACQFTQIK